MNNFLILGTGDDINDIDFSRVNDEWITAGVNRIYEKYIPDYYYVYDVNELMPFVPDNIDLICTHPAKLAEYFRERIVYDKNFYTYYDKDYTPGFSLYGKTFDCGHGSINYLIRFLNNHLFENEENVFYIAGVPLLEDVGHFYDIKETTSVQRVLDRFYNDFLRLVDQGYRLVSLMEKSKLNNILPVKDKDIIYSSPPPYNHNGEYQKKIKGVIDELSRS